MCGVIERDRDASIEIDRNNGKVCTANRAVYLAPQREEGGDKNEHVPSIHSFREGSKQPARHQSTC